MPTTKKRPITTALTVKPLIVTSGFSNLWFVIGYTETEFLGKTRFLSRNNQHRLIISSYNACVN